MVALRFAALEIDNMCRHLVWHLAFFHANLIFCENFMFVMQGPDTCNLWVICFSDLASSKHLPAGRSFVLPTRLGSREWTFHCESSLRSQVFHVFSCSCPLCLGAAVYVFTTFLAKGGGSEINLLPTLWLNICIFSWHHYRIFSLQKILDDWPKPKQFCFALVQSNHIVWRWHYFALTCHLPPIWTQLFCTSFLREQWRLNLSRHRTAAVFVGLNLSPLLPNQHFFWGWVKCAILQLVITLRPAKDAKETGK